MSEVLDKFDLSALKSNSLETSRQRDKYQFICKLAHSANRQIFLALDKSNDKEIVMKIEQKTEQNILQNEMAQLKSVSHHNIVRCLDYFETPSQRHLVTEYLSGGDLAFLISRKTKLSESFASIIFLQLIDAVAYLHRQNVAHSNIQPANVVIGPNCVKLVDFSLSTTNQRVIPQSHNWQHFSAPEDVTEPSHEPKAADMWQLGCLLYQMVTGARPFWSENREEMRKKIVDGKYLRVAGGTEELQDLLKNLLAVNPDRRATADVILKNRWVRQSKLAVRLPVPE